MFILIFLKDIIHQFYKVIKAQLAFVVFLLIFFFCSIELFIFIFQSTINYGLSILNIIIDISYKIIFLIFYNFLFSLVLFFFSLLIYFLFYIITLVLEINSLFIFLFEFISYNIEKIYFIFFFTELNSYYIMICNYINEIFNQFSNIFNTIFLNNEIFYYIFFNFFGFISLKILVLIFYIIWFFECISSLDFVQPFLKIFIYIFLIGQQIFLLLYWFISNLLKLLIVCFIQFISFLMHIIVPLDHGGSQYQPFPELTAILAKINKSYYYPDLYHHFFIFTNKMFEYPVNIFIFFKNIYENLFEIQNLWSYIFYKKHLISLINILNTFDQLSWYQFYKYTFGSYISYIYLYVNLSHLFVYIVFISLFVSWFVFKGWMDIQLERVNSFGFLEIFIIWLQNIVTKKIRIFLLFFLIILLFWFIL